MCGPVVRRVATSHAAAARRSAHRRVGWLNFARFQKVTAPVKQTNIHYNTLSLPKQIFIFLLKKNKRRGRISTAFSVMCKHDML